MPHRREEPLTFELHLRRRAVWRVVAVLALANLVFLAATWLRATSGPFDYLPGYALRQLDIRTEKSLSAWYSALLLLAAAAASLLAFASARLVAGRAARRTLDLGWIALAVLFAGLSLDEVAALHEGSATIGPNPFEGQLDDWVGVLAVPMAAVGLACLAFAWLNVRHTAAPFALFLTGLGLFATVPAQEQLQNWMRAHHGGRPVYLALLEEGAEVFGALAFVASGLLYALGRRDALRLSFAVPPGTALRIAAALPIALGCGLLAVDRGLRALGVPFGGTPSGWFGGVAALVAGVAALVVWQRRRGAPDGVAWLVAGAAALVVATDLGTGRAVTEQLWPGSPRRQLAVRALLVVPAVAAAGALVLARHGPVRWAVLLWTVGAVASIASLPGSTSLLLAGAGAMLWAGLAERGPAAPASAAAAALACRRVLRWPEAG